MRIAFCSVGSSVKREEYNSGYKNHLHHLLICLNETFYIIFLQLLRRCARLHDLKLQVPHKRYIFCSLKNLLHF